MWCIVTSRTCSAASSCISRTRHNGPVLRLNGRLASSSASRRASGSRSAAGNESRSTVVTVARLSDRTTCATVPSIRRNVVRSTSWRRTISWRARSSAVTSSCPETRSAEAMLYCAVSGCSWSRNQSRCCANDAAETNSNWSILYRAGAGGRDCLTKRGCAANDAPEELP